MGKIVYETGMNKMPDNCCECMVYFCTLPMRTDKPDCVKKPFMKKRHRNCPLVEVEEE